METFLSGNGNSELNSAPWKISCFSCQIRQFCATVPIKSICDKFYDHKIPEFSWTGKSFHAQCGFVLVNTMNIFCYISLSI